MGALNFKDNSVMRQAFCERMAENGNLSQSAKEVGVGRETVYALMRKDAEFKDDVSRARLEYTSRMAKEFREHAPEALSSLLEVIRSNKAPATARVAAARAIIDYSRDWSDTDEMETRIAGLKADIAEAEEVAYNG